MVGPLNVKEAGPLPPDLEEFVSNSGGHGFILVAFGSNMASILPRKLIDMLATAFGKLKQRVVWRLKGMCPEYSTQRDPVGISCMYVNRHLAQTTTETRTSLNKRFNEQYNGFARAL